MVVETIATKSRGGRQGPLVIGRFRLAAAHLIAYDCEAFPMSRLVGLRSFVTVTIVGNALCSVGLVRALTGRLCGVYLVEAPVVLGCDVHVLAVAGAEDAAECFVV